MFSPLFNLLLEWVLGVNIPVLYPTYFIFQEVEIINNVQDLLKKTIKQSETQIA